MRTLCFLFCLLLACPALADELIRFRMADGTIGLVDDEKKLPVGAIVESRKPLAAMRGEAARVAALSAPAATAAEATTHAATRAPGEYCAHFGLAAGCLVQHVDEATTWCERGAASRRKHDALDKNAALEWASYDACRERGATCTRSGLSQAEQKLAKAERTAEKLSEQCLDEGCRAAWLRMDCALPAALPH